MPAGNNQDGHYLCRLEVAADVAKGQEYKIGLMNDTALSPASGFAI